MTNESRVVRYCVDGHSGCLVKERSNHESENRVMYVTHADYRAPEERYERWKKDWDDVHNATVEELAALRARVENMFGKGRRDDCDCQECVSFRSLRTKS